MVNVYFLCTNDVCGLYYREQFEPEGCLPCGRPLLKMVGLSTRQARVERLVKEILAALKTEDME